MGRKGKRTEGLEEAHPFTGMSQVNPNAAGVGIAAVEVEYETISVEEYEKKYQV
jgi:hypothetical protein